jgi:ChrB-like protein
MSRWRTSADVCGQPNPQADAEVADASVHSVWLTHGNAALNNVTVVAPDADSRVGRWVLLAYRIPRTPSTPRIAVWRKLRALGVAQLGDGLVGLPEDARTREQLEWVAADVDAAGGSAMLWRAEALSGRDEQRLVAQLAAARAQEYQAILDRATQHGEHAVEPGERARLLVLLRRELRRVRRRDYFPPVEAELARRAVENLAQPGPRSTSAAATGKAPGTAGGVPSWSG